MFIALNIRTRAARELVSCVFEPQLSVGSSYEVPTFTLKNTVKGA